MVIMLSQFCDEIDFRSRSGLEKASAATLNQQYWITQRRVLRGGTPMVRWRKRIARRGDEKLRSGRIALGTDIISRLNARTVLALIMPWMRQAPPTSCQFEAQTQRYFVFAPRIIRQIARSHSLRRFRATGIKERSRTGRRALVRNRAYICRFSPIDLASWRAIRRLFLL